MIHRHCHIRYDDHDVSLNAQSILLHGHDHGGHAAGTGGAGISRTHQVRKQK